MNSAEGQEYSLRQNSPIALYRRNVQLNKLGCVDAGRPTHPAFLPVISRLLRGYIA
jgi:hypothetical protein